MKQTLLFELIAKSVSRLTHEFSRYLSVNISETLSRLQCHNRILATVINEIVSNMYAALRGTASSQ